jgi:hypothetical protein
MSELFLVNSERLASGRMTGKHLRKKEQRKVFPHHTQASENIQQKNTCSHIPPQPLDQTQTAH